MPTTPTSANAAAALEPPARTHQEAAALFRRPFAPGAIGFRAMTKVPYRGQPYAGAQVAAYLNAQSVLHRLNAVVPGRWRHQFAPLPADLAPADSGARRLYLACRLIVTLPLRDGGPDVEAVYEDIGELDAGSWAGLKALYSDARKRAAVAAGIGAYLYTALAPVVLPIGPSARQVQSIRRAGKSDLLTLSADTEQWLRNGYRTRLNSPAALRDLGPVLAHGEPDDGMGQGESTDQAAHATEPAATDSAPPDETAAAAEPVRPPRPATAAANSSPSTSAASGPTSRPPPDLRPRGPVRCASPGLRPIVSAHHWRISQMRSLHLMTRSPSPHPSDGGAYPWTDDDGR